VDSRLTALKEKILSLDSQTDSFCNIIYLITFITLEKQDSSQKALLEDKQKEIDQLKKVPLDAKQSLPKTEDQST
jgi:hypothetical protein